MTDGLKCWPSCGRISPSLAMAKRLSLPGRSNQHFSSEVDGRCQDSMTPAIHLPSRSFKSALQFGGGWQVSWNPDYPYFHLLMKGEACTAATAGLMAAILDDLAPIVRFARVDFNVDVLISRAI